MAMIALEILEPQISIHILFELLLLLLSKLLFLAKQSL